MKPNDLDAFLQKIQKTNTCWLWKGSCFPSGYGQFKYWKKNWKAHRFSYIAYKGNIPPSQLVLHKCDNRKCVNPEHLYLGTHQDNMRDMVTRNRQAKGSHNGGGKKLIEENIYSIRISKKPVKLLAEEYNVHISTIYKIRKRQIWQM